MDMVRFNLFLLISANCMQRCKARFRNGKDLDNICLKEVLGKNTNLFSIKTKIKTLRTPEGTFLQ